MNDILSHLKCHFHNTEFTIRYGCLETFISWVDGPNGMNVYNIASSIIDGKISLDHSFSKEYVDQVFKEILDTHVNEGQRSFLSISTDLSKDGSLHKNIIVGLSLAKMKGMTKEERHEIRNIRNLCQDVLSIRLTGFQNALEPLKITHIEQHGGYPENMRSLTDHSIEKMIAQRIQDKLPVPVRIDITYRDEQNCIDPISLDILYLNSKDIHFTNKEIIESLDSLEKRISIKVGRVVEKSSQNAKTLRFMDTNKHYFKIPCVTIEEAV